MANRTETVLNLRHSRDREHGRFEAVFLARTEPETSIDPGFRNPNDSLVNGLYLADLIVYGLYSVGKETKPEEISLWGENLVYRRPYSVNLTSVEKMSKTLKALDRKLTKMHETRGYSKDYADLLLRVAEITGSKVVVASNDSRWLNSTEFRTLSPEGVRDWMRVEMDRA